MLQLINWVLVQILQVNKHGYLLIKSKLIIKWFWLFIMLDLIDWVLVQILQVNKHKYLLIKFKLIINLVNTLSFLVITEALSVIIP